MQKNRQDLGIIRRTIRPHCAQKAVQCGVSGLRGQRGCVVNEQDWAALLSPPLLMSFLEVSIHGTISRIHGEPRAGL